MTCVPVASCVQKLDRHVEEVHAHSLNDRRRVGRQERQD